MKIEFAIKYPPSINHYYKHTRRAFYLSKKAWSFRESVVLVARGLNVEMMLGPLSISLMVFPPDRRKRDLDNIIKPVQDSFQYAKIIYDDNQICEIYMKRMKVIKGGKVDICLRTTEEVE